MNGYVMQAADGREVWVRAEDRREWAGRGYRVNDPERDVKAAEPADTGVTAAPVDAPAEVSGAPLPDASAQTDEPKPRSRKKT